MLSGTFTEVDFVSTWMGDHEGRLGAMNLGLFVGVDLNLWPTVYIAVIVLTLKWINKMRTCCIWELRVASNNNTNWAVELSSIVHCDELSQRCLVERVPLSIGRYYWRSDLNLSDGLIRRRCLADLTAAKYTPPQINKIVLYCIH